MSSRFLRRRGSSKSCLSWGRCESEIDVIKSDSGRIVKTTTMKLFLSDIPAHSPPSFSLLPPAVIWVIIVSATSRRGLLKELQVSTSWFWLPTDWRTFTTSCWRDSVVSALCGYTHRYIIICSLEWQPLVCLLIIILEIKTKYCAVLEEKSQLLRLISV